MNNTQPYEGRDRDRDGIAIVGMAGRFPKARNVDEFWRNLCAGVDAISFFSDEEMAAAGVSFPRDNPRYVKARGVLEDADLFDAAFFGIGAREAEVMDPQHRLFLECAVEALEDAGCDPDRFDGSIGVFAGGSMNTYLTHCLLGNRSLRLPELTGLIGDLQLLIGNDKDFLPTRVSYKLNLKGPSLNIQTACSTALVAVNVACQHLLTHQCDAALAGAVSVSFPQKRGGLYQDGGIVSPDGRCRAFDHKAGGTVPGEGVGVVFLKRLEDALAHGDPIYAVIKGFALNNDGSGKVGYTAPSVDGQAEVIAMAQAMAGVEPCTIGYVEAHGTATPLGDPIEIEGLKRAFQEGVVQPGSCALGSVKTNIGHLDTAAGIAGLIKTALTLHHGKIPPNLHFEALNPKIDLAGSPFFVNTRLRDWVSNGSGTPRRAGVSSFGVGGTNAHAVLEEAPAPEMSGPSRALQLLLLSARSRAALDRMAANLATHLERNPGIDLADVAHTLQTGRREFSHRRFVVCRTGKDAVNALRTEPPNQVLTRHHDGTRVPVTFLFPGQGAQYLNMGRAIYEAEPVFRRQLDECARILEPELGLDLRSVLYPTAEQREQAERKLDETALAQPALFAIEYSLARLWMSWGVQPEALMGHSVGEYVAACLAGIFTLEDALRLIAARGRMMQEMSPGKMLAVRLGEEELVPWLTTDVSLASINGRKSCVISGPGPAVDALRARLEERGAACKPLRTSHAFHSPMMEPMLASFTQRVRSLKLSPPTIPLISNVTGTWMTSAQATDPAYWARHIRETVRFADGLVELRRVAERVFLEVGPGRTLTGLAGRPGADGLLALACPSLPAMDENSDEKEVLLKSLGELWLAGVSVDWRGFYQGETRRRVRLPAYPFERKRYWVTPDRERLAAGVSAGSAGVPSRSGQAQTVASSLSDEASCISIAVGEGTRAPASRPAEGSEISAAVRGLLTELSGEDYAQAPGDQPFASLGLDSLVLMQLTLAVERRFGVRLNLRDLLDRSPTIDDLTRRIQAEQSPPGSTAAVSTEANSIKPSSSGGGPGPMTHGQEGNGKHQADVVRNAPPAAAGADDCAWAPPAAAVGAPGETRRDGVPNTRLPGALRDTPSGALTSDGLEWVSAGDPKTALVVSLPLTPTQRELWFAAQVSEAASCVYNESRFLRLEGTLNVEALRTALQRLVDRHEALRTTFTTAGDWQRIHSTVSVTLPVEDWSGLDSRERSTRLEAVRTEEAEEPFDLVKGPLIRARLCRYDSDEHLLVLTVHHLICDGYSAGILLSDLGHIYASIVSASPLQLPSPLQFSDYARARTRALPPAKMSAEEAFWRGMYAGGVPALDLPTDLPRPATWQFAGARQARVVPEATLRGLLSVSADARCTLFATLLAGFVLLLRRLSGQEDLVVGIPAADRATEGGASVVGHCVKFLAVRYQVRDEQTVKEHLASVQSTFLDAYEHHHHTFGTLLQQLNLPRDPSRPPLVAVTFNFERMAEPPEFRRAVTSLTLNPQASTNFELSVNVTEQNETLQVDCRYSTSLFLPETIERWLNHFVTLLDALARSPESAVAALPLLTESERQRILTDWNQTSCDYPRHACLHHLVEEQVLRTPEAIALVWEDEALTYRELDQKASRLARELQAAADFGPESLAGIFMERTPLMVIGVLAVLKAGGAYVPLDPTHPRERLELILQGTMTRVILTEAHLAGLLANSGIQLIDVGAILRSSGTMPEGVPSVETPAVTPANLAYVIPTSGSTGTPKCVAVEHRSAVNCVHYLRRTYSPEELSHVLFSTSLCFDISVAELFVPLSAGGQVIVAKDIFQLPQIASRTPVTLMQTVPSAGAELIRLGAVPASVRVVNLAGEPLSAALADRFYRLPGIEKVCDLYGPSETTVYSTRALRRPGGPAIIGRPIANTRIYILDAHGNPVPVGVRGELFIGGDGLARGYLHRPDLTGSGFVPDPFERRPGARMYRTGDVARWLPDGTIEFLGRGDYQVKVRGYRVELGEVEAVLSQHPAVRACAVMARDDDAAGRRLVGYVVHAPDGTPANASRLRRFVRERLPEYMVPASFVFLPALPVTASGKIDRRALPAPEDSRPDLESAFALPSTPTEEALVRIWRGVLGIEQIGTHDNFFEIGGHSLLVAQVISRVRQSFQVELPFRSLFESPTIAGVGRTIEDLVFREITEGDRPRREGRTPVVHP